MPFDEDAETFPSITPVRHLLGRHSGVTVEMDYDDDSARQASTVYVTMTSPNQQATVIITRKADGEELYRESFEGSATIALPVNLWMPANTKAFFSNSPLTLSIAVP